MWVPGFENGERMCVPGFQNGEHICVPVPENPGTRRDLLQMARQEYLCTSMASETFRKFFQVCSRSLRNGTQKNGTLTPLVVVVVLNNVHIKFHVV